MNGTTLQQEWLMLRGEATPLDPGEIVRAGHLYVTYLPGELRYLRWQTDAERSAWPDHGQRTSGGLAFDTDELRSDSPAAYTGRPVLLRLYAAVRDENWGTVPTKLNPRALLQRADGFDIRVDGETDHPTVKFEFEWSCTASEAPGGEVTLRVDYRGVAKSAFRRNRIGLCVLHPASLAGHGLRVVYVDGRTAQAAFPTLLDPRQPPPGLTELAGLEHTVPYADAVASMRFTGDAFEMEDQRNWTDASFKTFCTPLSRPFPVQVNPGDVVQQSVELRVRPVPPTSRPRVRTVAWSRQGFAEVTLPALNDVRRSHLPAVGTMLPDDAQAPDSGELADLASIGLSHVRVNVPLGTEGWLERLSAAAAICRKLACPAELAVYVPGDASADWPLSLGKAVQAAGLRVRFVTLLHAMERYAGQPFPPPGGFSRRQLLEAFGAMWVGGEPTAGGGKRPAAVAVGSDGDAIFLGRMTGLPPVGADTLAVQINPQTHAGDETSMLETLTVQSVVLETAAVLGLGRGVAATPVLLRARRNLYAYATGNFAPLPPDLRIRSVWAAGWTLGSLAALASAGAAWITFHTAFGQGGLARTPTARLLRELRPSEPQGVRVLRGPDVNESLPLCSAVAIEGTSGVRLLVANHMPRPVHVRLPAHPSERREVARWRLSWLDKRFDASAELPDEVHPSHQLLMVEPYAVALACPA